MLLYASSLCLRAFVLFFCDLGRSSNKLFPDSNHCVTSSLPVQPLLPLFPLPPPFRAPPNAHRHLKGTSREDRGNNIETIPMSRVQNRCDNDGIVEETRPVKKTPLDESRVFRVTDKNSNGNSNGNYTGNSSGFVVKIDETSFLHELRTNL